jgi:hypothetical protein
VVAVEDEIFGPSPLQDQAWAERVLVCGYRDWTDIESIEWQLRLCVHMKVLIHGGARGADTIGGNFGKKLGSKVKVLEFKADWNKYGRAAGPIRNKQMLEEGLPDFVLAFHDDLESSKGTKHMVTLARKAGIPVKVCHSISKGEK